MRVDSYISLYLNRSRNHAIAIGLQIIVIMAVIIPGAWAQERLGSEARPIKLGVYPYINANKLRHDNEVVMQYVLQHTGIHVNIYVASDYLEFVQWAQSEQLDLLISPAHFSLLLTKNHHYSPIAQHNRPVQVVLISLKDQPINHIEQLPGHRLAISDRYSLVSLMAMDLIRKSAHVKLADIDIIDKKNHDRSILSVLNKESSAGFISRSVLKALPKDTTDRLYVLALSGELPADMILAHARLLAHKDDRIRQFSQQFRQLYHQGTPARLKEHRVLLTVDPDYRENLATLQAIVDQLPASTTGVVLEAR